MRFRTLIFVLSVAGCGDSNPNNKVNPNDDLSMSGDDLSMNQNGDSPVMAPDLSPLTPSGMILAVRNAGDQANTPDGGMLAMSIPVVDVFVTYLRPEVSGETDDPPGFFVQAEMNGPALFVRVDPATLSPVPQVGDLVRFTVTGAGKDGGNVHQATSLTDWSVESSGHSLIGLTQMLSSATDLASGLDNYESELINVSGTVNSNFSSSGAGYVQATFNTTGVPTGASVKLRLPVVLRDAIDVVQGCTVTLGPTPMWRFKTTAQPSAWVSADLQLSNCPAMRVTSAIASDLTHVVITFDHVISASSLLANGTQFTFDNGLTVDNGTGTAAVLSAPNQVTVTTSGQSGSTLYTVTVGTTIDDLRGALDAAHNTTTFAGFTPPATLIITEYNPNIGNGLDLVELKALNGGSVAGFKLYQDFTKTKRTLLSTLPANLVVATGDYLLVHLNVPPSPSPSPAPVVTEFNVGNANGSPITQCTNTTCVNTAWDIAGTEGTPLPYASRRLISIYDGLDVAQDAVAYYSSAGGNGGYGAELQAAIDQGYWTTASVVATCEDVTNFTTSSFKVGSTPALGTAPAGNSAQRKPVTNQHSGQGDWLIGASRWGLDPL